MNPILTGLSIALGISVLANAFLGHAYLNQRDATTTVKTETVYVTAAAKECSKGTEALVNTANKNAAAAAPKRAAAASQAEAHDKKADQILASNPAGADSCAKAETLVDDWWKGRKP